MARPLTILGIETSCDETAAAVVDGTGRVLSNLVLSQIDEHRVFGGVVPEIAARAHLDHLDRLIAAALEDAGTDFGGLDGIAATCGPGLIGGVMVGMMAGKAIAAARGLPFIGINHLEAHVLTPRLTDGIAFPYLALLVSGGHTQILSAEDLGKYRQWGATADDAAGECFDKCAKLMGLPYPGGPNLEKMAAQCADPEEAARRFPLPRPMKGRPGCDFSFSGLKTAVRAHVDSLPEGKLQAADIAALASSFQQAVADVLADRCAAAMKPFMAQYEDRAPKPAFAVVGGVAANKTLRAALEKTALSHGMAFAAPPPALCSDNAAMIAWAGAERLGRGLAGTLDMPARPRWPLEEMNREAAARGRGGKT